MYRKKKRRDEKDLEMSTSMEPFKFFMMVYREFFN